MSTPEREVCQVCDREYPVWFAPSPLWNRVMRDGDRANPCKFSFICPTCFALTADEQNGEPLVWTLLEDGKYDEYQRAELAQARADSHDLWLETLRLREIWDDQLAKRGELLVERRRAKSLEGGNG